MILLDTNVLSELFRPRPISVADGQIAAVCRQYEATLVTRNVRDFEGLGLDLIDPWSG